MSNEVKIALLAIAAIGLSYWGYKFILGKNVLVNSNVYYVEYEDVDELMIGTNVTISGVAIGSVATINLIEKEKGRVVVMLDLQKDVRIPKSAVAAIYPTGFMGGKVVKLEFDEPCEGNNCAQNGDYLRGATFGMMAYMLGEDGMTGMMAEVKEGVSSIIDSLNQKLLSDESGSPIAGAVKDLRKTLSNLESATLQMDVVIRKSSGKIDGTLDNLQAISGTIENKSDQISDVLDNASTLSKQLVAADIASTLKDVDASIVALRSTLNETKSTVDGINGIVRQVQSGEGSLGKLIQDDQLYDNLSDLTFQFDSLATDLQDRPYRYFPFKSRNKVKKYDRKDEAQGSN